MGIIFGHFYDNGKYVSVTDGSVQTLIPSGAIAFFFVRPGGSLTLFTDTQITPLTNFTDDTV